MKITITNYSKTYSAECDEDVDIQSVADMFKGLLVTMGYHPSNVDEIINTEYKWFTEEERDGNMQGHLNSSNKFVEDWYDECKRETDEEKQKRAEDWQHNMYNQIT